MKKIIETQEEIKILIKELSNRAFEINGNKIDFSDKELFDVTVIFFEVFSSKMYDYNLKKKVSSDKMLQNAHQSGKEIREVIKTFTGVDMKKIFKSKEA